jgi:hypothetical protein
MDNIVQKKTSWRQKISNFSNLSKDPITKGKKQILTKRLELHMSSQMQMSNR